MKVFKSINEWKESDNYLFAKWFDELKLKIKDWFNDDFFKELEYDYFEFDSSHNGPIHTAFLFFNEKTIEWKLDIILNSDELNEDKTIDVLSINLHGYNKITQSSNIDEDAQLGELLKEIDEPEFTPDFLIELINEFKEKFKKDDMGTDE